ncbi:cation transporter [Streptomyces sp. NPDC055134]
MGPRTRQVEAPASDTKKDHGPQNQAVRPGAAWRQLPLAVVKAVAGLLSGSPRCCRRRSHSVADSMNEVFLLAALRCSRRPAATAPVLLGARNERCLWSLLAAVGIFVVGGCFSFVKGIAFAPAGVHQCLRGGTLGTWRSRTGRGGSLLRALHQVRHGRGGACSDPALRAPLSPKTAHLSLAFCSPSLAWSCTWSRTSGLGGVGLSAIGLLLVYVAYRLGRDARGQLIGEAVGPELRGKIHAPFDAQPRVACVVALPTMQFGLDRTLFAAGTDLRPGCTAGRASRSPSASNTP